MGPGVGRGGVLGGILDELLVVGVALGRNRPARYAAALPECRLQFPFPARQPQRLRRRGVEVAGAGIRAAQTDAVLTLVVFWDYECQACRRLAPRLARLQARHPGSVAVVYRLLPQSGNAASQTAATAAYCAAEQGRFTEVHAELLRHRDLQVAVGWPTLAKLASITDSLRFRTCLDSSATASDLAADSAAADRFGIRATPAIAMGQEIYIGAPRNLEALVESRLAGRTQTTP